MLLNCRVQSSVYFSFYVIHVTVYITIPVLRLWGTEEICKPNPIQYKVTKQNIGLLGLTSFQKQSQRLQTFPTLLQTLGRKGIPSLTTKGKPLFLGGQPCWSAVEDSGLVTP